MGINWTEIIISVCTLLITGILIPLIRTLIQKGKNELSADTQASIHYWVEVGVRWAKQWMQTETGEKKKQEVLKFVSDKMDEMGIDVSEEELDKIIEAIYEQVKQEAIAPPVSE